MRGNTSSSTRFGTPEVKDPRNATPRRHTSAGGELIGCIDMGLHILLPGDRFDLENRRIVIPPIPQNSSPEDE